MINNNPLPIFAINLITLNMKKQLNLLLAAVVLFASCSKSNDAKPKVTTDNTVTIEGTTYPTVKINGQTWTTVNYNGAGGHNYDDSTVNIPSYGKLYNAVEANAIVLPSGWRIPSSADFHKLDPGLDGSTGIDSAKLHSLMSKAGWIFPGNNTSGFNAVPTGEYQEGAMENSFRLRGWMTSFFGIDCYYVIIEDDNGDILGSTNERIDAAKFSMSLRFVKDN